MPKFLDLAGQRYGRLVATKIDHRRGHLTFWLCRCDCGKDTVVSIGHLRNGHTQSCGCLHDEAIKVANMTHGHAANGKRSVEFGTWSRIHTRCTNPNNRSYKDYGGRGIFVCERWSGKDGFRNFLADMGKRPRGKFSLGRKDNDGPYSKDNCRWETKAQQAQNTRSTVNITCFGRTQCRAAWSRETGLSEAAITYRLSHWRDVERALSTKLPSGFQRPGDKPETAGENKRGIESPEWELTG